MWEEVDFVRAVVSPVVEKHYPSKANHEKMSLFDLIAFGVMTHRHFGGVYKKAYRVLAEDLKLFPKVRYNKIGERLNRYEELLMDCLGLFKLEGLWILSLLRRRGLPGFGDMRRKEDHP